MAESSGSKGFKKTFNKKLFRTKEKVLQNLGKADKTTDTDFDEHVVSFNRQSASTTKLQKELKNYMQCVKAMNNASQSFYEALRETYEEEWEGHPHVAKIVEDLRLLRDDYQTRLNEEVCTHLHDYANKFPEYRNKISKRGRKLIDYDSARHNLNSLEQSKKRDELKIQKAQLELVEAETIYKSMNNELNKDLAQFNNRKIEVFATYINLIASVESKFEEESAKSKQELLSIAERLHSSDGSYSSRPRPRIYNTPHRNGDLDEEGMVNLSAIEGHNLSRYQQNTTTTESDSESESRPQSNVRDSRHSGHSSIESSPKDPRLSEVEFKTHNGDHGDRSPTVEDSYEPVTIGRQDDPSEEIRVATPEDKKPAPAPASATPDVVQVKPKEQEKETEEIKFVDNRNVQLNDFQTGESTDESPVDVKPIPPPDFDTEGDEETSDQIYKVPSNNEPVNSKVPKDANILYKEEDAAVYEVPKSNQPVNDKVPKDVTVLFKVIATHPYQGEDTDELTFDQGDVIAVIPFDDPDEQDDGWLMGIKETTGHKGVFPANFCKRL